MGWVLRLVETKVNGSSRSGDVMVIDCAGNLGDVAALGPPLAQGKRLMALVQQEIVSAQSRDHAAQWPECRTCTIPCQVKDYRPRQIATGFGQVVLRLTRFRCAGCGGTEAGVDWPSHSRSTPELDQLRAHLSAFMPYGIAAGLLEHLLPVDAGIHSDTVRRRTLVVGEQLRDPAPAELAAPAAATTLTLDSTFIWSCEDVQRHLEVRLGNVEASNGVRQVCAAVARTDSPIKGLILCGLREVGQSEDTELTAFTDGCLGLRSILANAGVTKPSYLAWFHIAMRLHHAEKTASTLSSETPEQVNAKAAIVAAVERLRWRIWNGRAKDAKATIERIRAVIPAFQGEQGGRKKDSPSRQLWTALREIDRYLTSQSA